MNQRRKESKKRRRIRTSCEYFVYLIDKVSKLIASIFYKFCIVACVLHCAVCMLFVSKLFTLIVVWVNVLSSSINRNQFCPIFHFGRWIVAICAEAIIFDFTATNLLHWWKQERENENTRSNPISDLGKIFSLYVKQCERKKQTLFVYLLVCGIEAISVDFCYSTD